KRRCHLRVQWDGVPSCKYQCTCLDGAVGCVPLCGMDIRLPSPDCPMPRRVKVPGKCCEEWNTFVGSALA
ncbi:hypothetical protein M9458_040251, partial [Cirrhinus mrigala]